MVKHGVPQLIDLSQREERVRILALLEAIAEAPEEGYELMSLLRQYPRPGGTYAKSQLLRAYRQFVEEGVFPRTSIVERRLRGRPVRTLSGVAPVAILTRPYPCPGQCIFCPAQKGAPKSYLDGEPGVLRARQNEYDPFAQTTARIEALEAIGHPTDKVELLILGGSWSAYPVSYQTWFLKRAFDALNEDESLTLSDALRRNERARHRNVGLVIETRPDMITPDEVLRLRRQGVTKVQLGIQSLDDRILVLNRRGHTVEATRRAIRWLRLGGFKIVAHWMPNLYGATPESDLQDFTRLFEDTAIRPDELKIYPTALLRDTELYHLWEQGQYQPYEENTLTELLIACKQRVPPYCRINRVMRDIPAGYIVAGTKKSNLRQIVLAEMARRGLHCQCIRCREVRGRAERDDLGAVKLDVVAYETPDTQERFLQFLTSENRLAGFLRLSLPRGPRVGLPIPEIRDVAMVREVHVYGPTQSLGEHGRGAQHRGLGSELLEAAADMVREAGYRELAVIAAVGTREYYRTRGFTRGTLYLIRDL